MLTIGERVRRARAKAGLSARGLSTAAGLSPSAVYQIERRGGMSLETARALARVLGVSVEALCGRARGAA